MDLTTREWTKATENGDTFTRGGAAAVPSTDGHTFVLFGGSEGTTPQNDVRKFDTNTLEWTLVAATGTSPSARIHVCI